MNKKKSIIFAIVLNIFTLVLSIFYIALSVLYFIQFNWVSKQDGDGYMFLLLFMSVGVVGILIVDLIPLMRFINLIVSIVAAARLKNGKKTKIPFVISGIVQLADVALDFSGGVFVIYIIAYCAAEISETFLMLAEDPSSLMGLLAAVLFFIPWSVKSVLQIVSSVLLMSSALKDEKVPEGV